MRPAKKKKRKKEKKKKGVLQDRGQSPALSDPVWGFFPSPSIQRLESAGTAAVSMFTLNCSSKSIESHAEKPSASFYPL